MNGPLVLTEEQTRLLQSKPGSVWHRGWNFEFDEINGPLLDRHWVPGDAIVTDKHTFVYQKTRITPFDQKAWLEFEYWSSWSGWSDRLEREAKGRIAVLVDGRTGLTLGGYHPHDPLPGRVVLKTDWPRRKGAWVSGTIEHRP